MAILAVTLLAFPVPLGGPSRMILPAWPFDQHLVWNHLGGRNM